MGGATGSDDELLASEHRLKVLLGCTKGIVFEFDREGRYLNAWTHDAGLLARPPHELIGRTIDEVLGPAGQRFTEAIQRVHDTGTPETIEYELAVQGGPRWFAADVVVSPAVARERTVVYLVRDITAHKLLEEQLRQAQRMESIGRLAGGIAHDFNNILQTITGYSEMLVDSLESSIHRKQAAHIRHAAERAIALTKQLLAYGRKRMFVPELLDVNAIIANMADMLARVIGGHIELRLELDPSQVGTRMDRSGLEQIIMNLSVNARDALHGGGTLVWRTERIAIDEAFCARRVDVSPGDYVLIVATDTGHGMDAATQARIFEPFFTTKALGKGTGLGLSTVYGIIKQSGGHIEVESAPGAGTTFRVYLPRAELPAPVASAVEPTAAAENLSVLVAEDDEELGEIICDHLESVGHRVVLADDGVRALDLARLHAIDLLVTERVLPGMHGDVLARRIRELRASVRVLYISGHPDESESAADICFLQKPFTRQRLVQQVGVLFEVPAR